MKRISVRRVASVIATAMAMTLVFATLGWAMMPQWNTRPYTKHIVIASADTTITPAHANIPHEGRYRTRETRLSIKTGDGVTLPAVLREPVGAPGPRPACLFIHGSGTSGAEDFGDIANAMASAGIVTLVPAKRNDNYTVLHRDYPRFAREYGRSLDVLRGISGVDPAKTGIYAESEGTWIATILTSKRQDIAFAILTSAPVFNGREQMAMAVSAYTHEAGAPKPVVKDMAKLMSLDYAPFDLAYADFDADRYLKSLTMPVLVNYGTYDTAMPIEQGAQRVIATANKSGNENVTVRYFAGNHQMRAGEGLFTPNLPLAEGYTQALENWVNGVTAGTKADGWATPQVAGATPHQRFAAPQRTRSGIVGSLGVLAGLMVAGPVLIVMAAILGIGLTVFSWLQTLLAGRRSVATVRAMHATPSELGAAQRRMLHCRLICRYRHSGGGDYWAVVRLYERRRRIGCIGYASTAAVCRRMGGAANSDHAVGGAVCLGNGTCLVLPRRYRRCAARHMRDGSARHSHHTDDTGILGPILAVILPMCAGKWGLAGRLRWWSGCGRLADCVGLGVAGRRTSVGVSDTQ